LATSNPDSPPLSAAVILALALLYLLAGVTGHSPWKSEDVIHIDIAHGFLVHGGWLFPRIAGENWPHTAPLYHWVAAGIGKLLGGLLGFHDAARLATTFFGAIFLYSLTAAARAFHAVHGSRTTPLLALGTLGFLLPMHEAQPAVAGLAFAAIAYWGAGRVIAGKRHGSWLLGLGLGLSFPAHGLAGLIMAIGAVAAPVYRRDFRSLLIALVIAIPLIAAWPLALSSRSPELWQLWWRNEWAEATLARGLPDIRHIKQLAWAAWPVLPIALWSLWLNRRQIGALVVPLLGMLISLAWYLSGSSRTLALLPLLLPLTLLAAMGVERLRRGAANAFDWFALTTFSVSALLLWLGASAQALDWPPTIAKNFDKLAPGHDDNYALTTLIFALLLTVVWGLSWRLPRAPWRASLHWAAGTVLMWSLTALLWMSWIDHAKSYSSVALSLRAALPADANCVERSGIGTTQRASLDYFAGIRTTMTSAKRGCDWRLIVDDWDRTTPEGWVLRWHGQRPSDRKERWYLEQREIFADP
jgi:4-amino-4-deoxy-L-arabinose transferase-like glycosyltransferase